MDSLIRYSRFPVPHALLVDVADRHLGALVHHFRLKDDDAAPAQAVVGDNGAAAVAVGLRDGHGALGRVLRLPAAVEGRLQVRRQRKGRQF